MIEGGAPRVADEERQALRDAVALRVMGWHLQPMDWAYDQQAQVWHDAASASCVPLESWRPDEDDRQTSGVLQAMCAAGFEYLVQGSQQHARAAFLRDGVVVAEASAAEWRIAVLRAAVGARA